MIVQLTDSATASKEHFSRALLPLCGMRASAARGKEGVYLVPYPGLRRSIPLRTRDGASRPGLNYSAPLALVHRLVLRPDSLKCPSGPLARESSWKYQVKPVFRP
jgi:hypothetical protein